MSDIDIDKLRELILKSQEIELESIQKTKLLENKNDNRRKVKKINPKFCNEWSELDKDFQINRIIEYVDRHTEKEDLTEATSKKLRKLLVEALVNDQLDVEYDSVVGLINKIHKLHYNDNEGFFLGTYLNEDGNLPCRITKISKITTDDGIILTEDFAPVNSENTELSKKKISLIRK